MQPDKINDRNLKLVFKDKKAIIFDFDGTIADSLHLHEMAFRSCLSGYSLDFDYKDLSGLSTMEAIRRILKSNKFPIVEEEFLNLVKQKQTYASEYYKDSLSFIPGALSLIQILYKNDFDLYIGSSGSRKNVTIGLNTLGITKYFKKVVTSDDVSQSKPHPEIFQTILDACLIEPRKVLVIEDSESGIQAAIRAGIDVVCINTDLGLPLSDNVPVLSFESLIHQLQLEFF